MYNTRVFVIGMAVFAFWNPYLWLWVVSLFIVVNIDLYYANTNNKKTEALVDQLNNELKSHKNDIAEYSAKLQSRIDEIESLKKANELAAVSYSSQTQNQQKENMNLIKANAKLETELKYLKKEYNNLKELFGE